MTAARPFRIDVPQSELDWIRDRVQAYRWHEMPEGGGWAYGSNLDYMRELCAYWLSSFDWRKAEAALNAWPQYMAEIDCQTVHFYHVPKKTGGPPRPLIISHGWPGSVFEFLHLIGPLTDPAAHGGDPADAFDLVIPALPGYGFSGKPPRPIGPRKIAHYFHRLMTEVLGYQRYLAQGGDWGSTVSAWLAYDNPDHVAGVHLNMVGVRHLPGPGTPPNTPEEEAWTQAQQARFQAGGAYFLQQATRPQTLSYGMMDSPVGAAAWIVEKFLAWSDCDGDNIESRYTKDQLLTNVMIYLVTRSFNTATWLYRGIMEERTGVFPAGTKCAVPTGVAAFPGDTVYQTPPRSLAEKAYNIVHWTVMKKGGHFAALEEPGLFLGDVRAFARQIWS